MRYLFLFLIVMTAAGLAGAQISQKRTYVVPPSGELPPPPPPAVIKFDMQTQDPAQQMEIARHYRHSLGGVPQVANGQAESMKWYRKAADQGYTPAMRALGDIYANALGVPQDLGESERWYRRAAEKGDPEAMIALGKALTPEYPRFAHRDEEQAAGWYRKAAEQGNAAGMVYTAQALQNGRGVAKDKEAALEWYRRAADKGNAVAAMWVGIAENCKQQGRPPASCI